MGRKIDIEFNDKTYTIEYNRSNVIKLIREMQKNKEETDMAIDTIYYGLLLHHENDMPSRDDILGWLMVIPEEDSEKFVSTLQELVQEVISCIEKDKKQGNFKWEVKA